MKGEGEFMFLPQTVKSESPPDPSKSNRISRIKEEAEKLETIGKEKKTWETWLIKMKSDFNDAKDIQDKDVPASLKVSAWEEFMNSYKDNDPYVQEDDAMRAEAIKQLEYWKNKQSEIKQTIVTGTSTIIGKDGVEMALIPAGEFQMGDNNFSDAKVHIVYLDAFYIDKYEVTNAQYKKFMASKGYKAPGYWNDSNYNAPNQPVVGVSWNDAKAYADWAGKRLPTEAEWEKSARGGLVGKKYPWGDTLTYDDANYSGTGGKDIWNGTSPVGSFKPNGYGLYDMAGNVWEWCSDWYDSNYYVSSPKSNPAGPSSGSYRVLRGGSWHYYYDNNLRVPSPILIDPTFSTYLRVAYRYRYDPSNIPDSVGFRCAGLR